LPSATFAAFISFASRVSAPGVSVQRIRSVSWLSSRFMSENQDASARSSRIDRSRAANSLGSSVRPLSAKPFVSNAPGASRPSTASRSR
jgi:hypothetical protein